MPDDTPARILAWNQGRDRDMLQRKFARMRAAPFAFFRGSCHLFHADWPARATLDASPLAWISGDLHLENFGSYKGDNRLVYFDLNDFDEAVLAPCGRELARFGTSLRLAAVELGLADTEADALLYEFLGAYRAALQDGKARWIERALADGAIGTLMRSVSRRKRAGFLDRRTELRRGRRHLLTDGRHAVPASPREQASVRRQLQGLGRELGREAWFEVLDVARRVAGTGSLGIRRYVALVAGKGSPDRNALLDLKQALPSAARLAPGPRQPRWANEAERIVSIQRRTQAVSPALLRPLHLGKQAFVLRELQPSEDRLALASLDSHALADALRHMGRLVAWSHLRSSGRDGAAIADDWIAWSARTRWLDEVQGYSRRYAARVLKDWQRFRKEISA